MTVRKHNSVAMMPISTELNMVLCNCHDCCCVGYRAFKEQGGDVREMLAPSRFRAVFDHKKCTGCQKCLETCMFDAIEMRKYPESKKWKARVDPEMCMGCGNCFVKCPKKNVVSFNVVLPPGYILDSDEDVDVYAY